MVAFWRHVRQCNSPFIIHLQTRFALWQVPTQLFSPLHLQLQFSLQSKVCFPDLVLFLCILCHFLIICNKDTTCIVASSHYLKQGHDMCSSIFSYVTRIQNNVQYVMLCSQSAKYKVAKPSSMLWLFDYARGILHSSARSTMKVYQDCNSTDDETSLCALKMHLFT